MTFELISKWASPLLAALDATLTPAGRARLDALTPRKTYAYMAHTYLRLIPGGDQRRHLWDRISPKVVDQLRAGAADLVVDTSIETIFLPNSDAHADFAAIYGKLSDLGVSPERVILASSNLSAGRVHAGVVRDLGVKTPMRLWSSDFAMAYCADVLESDPAIQAQMAPQSRPKSPGKSDASLKHFLFLNRKIKPHRVTALAVLASRVGLDKAHVSFIGDGREAERASFEASLRRRAITYATPGDLQFPEQTVAEIMARFPILLPDSRGHDTAMAYARHSLEGGFYDSSFLSLVSETTFGADESLFITEKTLKPLYWRHPFIVLGDPGTLARLRDLGFRTFAPVIDEGYDAVTQPAARMTAILDEVTRIGRFDQVQIARARQALAEAMEHNLNHLRSGFRQRCGEMFLDSWEHVTWSAANPS